MITLLAAQDAPKDHAYIRVTALLSPAFVQARGTQQAAIKNMNLTGRETLETGRVGRMRLQIAERAILSMGSESDVELSCAESEPCVIQLRSGRTRLTVGGGEIPSSIEAKVPGMSCQVSRGDFLLTAGTRNSIEPFGEATFSCLP